MNKLIVGAFVAGVGLAGVSVSQAMPLAPIDQGPAGIITQVAQGCGLGWHRGPYGRCRPNVGPFVVEPPVVVRPRVCPLGYHLGPYGRACVPNY
jgi:hypothetical protein